MMMGNWCDCVALFCSLLVIQYITLNNMFIYLSNQRLLAVWYCFCGCFVATVALASSFNGDDYLQRTVKRVGLHTRQCR
jgi:hypothetical protein